MIGLSQAILLHAEEGMGSLVVLLLAERAPSEGPRSTRAIEDQPGYPMIEKHERAWKDQLDG